MGEVKKNMGAALDHEALNYRQGLLVVGVGTSSSWGTPHHMDA